MKSPFGFGVFLRVKFKKKNDSRQPNHIKHLLSGLNELLKGNFRSLGSVTGDLEFLSVDRELEPGADSLVAARQIGQQRALGVYITLGFPPSTLFR